MLKKTQQNQLQNNYLQKVKIKDVKKYSFTSQTNITMLVTNG